MIIAAVLAVVTSVMLSQQSNSVRTTYASIDRELYRTHLKSALETFYAIQRATNLRYADFVRGCIEARDLPRALNAGHGCSTVGGFTAFSNADLSNLAPAADLGVTFENSCTITQNASTCSPATSILRLNYEMHDFRFYFNGLLSTRNLSEYRLVMTGPNVGQPLTNRFAIQSNLPVLTHMDSTTATVIAETPSTLQSCPFEEWMPYRSGTGCPEYSEVGSGTGLVLHKERFFGLRTFDGKIVDLTKLSTSSFLVNEDGTLDGQPVFPPHCRAALVNADDATIISNGNHDELYIVHGQDKLTFISYVKKTGGVCTLHNICKLGEMAWGQGYAGIASDPMSNFLVPPADLSSLRYLQARFFLKTDLGKLLTAEVISEPGSGPVDQYTVNDAALNRRFTCLVNYDRQKQVVERSRTLGFERGLTNPLGYIIY